MKSRCRSPLLKPPCLCEAQKADCHASSGCSTGFISVMSPVSLSSCYLSILMDGLWIEAWPPHYDLYAFKILAQLNYVDWLNKWINVALIPGTWACRLTERTSKRKIWGYGQEDFFLLGIWGEPSPHLLKLLPPKMREDLLFMCQQVTWWDEIVPLFLLINEGVCT